MNYIKSIEIENFQSHKYSKLDFSERLNVIVGPSDNGKSAIIRALKWVLFNEPKGTDFITFGENFCKVTLTLSDGTKIIRERTKSKNIYRLIKDNQESVYEGFGNDIPVDILDTHKIKKVKIDKENDICLNISEQLEGPFLISQTNSFKSKAIGKIVGLNIIDEAIKEINRDLNYLQSETKSIKSNIDELNDKINKLSYVNEMEIYIKKKEFILNTLREKISLLQNLKNIEFKIKEIEYEEIKHKNIIQECSKVDYISLQSIENKLSMLSKLNRIHESLIFNNSEMKNQISIIDATNSINEISNGISKAENKYYIYDKILPLNKRYKEFSMALDDVQIILNKTKYINDIIEIYNKLDTQLEKLKLIFDKYIKLKSCNESINKGNEYMKKFKNLNKSEEDLLILYEQIDRYNKINNIFNNFNKLCTEFNSTMDLSSKYKKEVEELLDEYKAILKNYSICPVCGSDINEEKINNIIDNYQ